MLDTARRVLVQEAYSILSLRVDESFEEACRLLLNCKGRVIVMGMGKNSLIGRKIAATLARTGTPSFFVHPGEAAHGDLGAICEDDVIIMLSNSGETEELLSALPHLKGEVISLSGNPESTLALGSSVNINVGVESEAWNKAPTCSTTACLAMGDALAITLINLRGFTNEDFKRTHPGGALGDRNGHIVNTRV